MTRVRLAATLALVAATGCIDHYARVSRVNAPGSVPDLDEPLPFENGDPHRQAPPESPGTRATLLWTVPYVMWGEGRDGRSVTETGFQLRYETSESTTGGLVSADGDQVLVTVGGAVAQTRGGLPALVPGPLFAEVGVRHLLREVVPVEIGAGPVAYVDDHSIGGQLTLRFLMLVPLRFRYTDHGGFEVMGGIEIPWALLFSRSR